MKTQTRSHRAISQMLIPLLFALCIPAASTQAIAAQPDIHWMLGGHANYADTVSFSQSGQLIASGHSGFEGTVKIWDADTGQFLRTITAGGARATFSPDDSMILTNGIGFTQLFRLSDGEHLADFLAGEGHADSTFAPDGQIIATVGSDAGTEESIRIYTIEGELLHEIILHTGASVSGARFTPDSETLLTSQLRDPGNVRRISVKTGELRDMLPGNDIGISALDLSPDGSQFAAGGINGLIFVRDANDGAIIQVLDAAAGQVRAVAFSPEGLRLASTHTNNLIVIWSLETGQPIHSIPVNQFARDVSWSPDGLRIVVAGIGLDAVLIIDAQTGQSITSFPTFGEQLGNLAVSSESPALIAVSEFGPTVQVRRAIDGSLVREVDAIEGFINGIGLSPDGSRLLVVDSTSQGRVISIDDGSLIDTFPSIETFLSRPVLFSSDGTLVADTLFTEPLIVREIATGDIIASLDSTLIAAFSPNNEFIAGAYGFGGGSIRIWRLDDLTTFPTITVGQNTISLAFSPDSEMLAVGTQSGDILLFNIDDAQLIRTFQGPPGQVSALAFAPDGQVLSSANQFGTEPLIDLWRVSDGELIVEYNRDTGTNIAKLVATPDGQSFIAARRDATLMSFANPLAALQGDTDGDGDVDLVDFAQFQLCFSGPGAAPPAGCNSVDFDNDNDVDLADFGAFQLAFTGAE